MYIYIHKIQTKAKNAYFDTFFAEATLMRPLCSGNKREETNTMNHSPNQFTSLAYKIYVIDKKNNKFQS